MQHFEYLTVPAPLKGAKIKGLKTASERYAYQLTALLNQLGGEGWEFLRAETLPSEERKGLTGTTLVQHNLLVFRRPSGDSLADSLAKERRASAAPTPTLEAPATGGPVYAARPEPQFRDRPARDDATS